MRRSLCILLGIFHHFQAFAFASETQYGTETGRLRGWGIPSDGSGSLTLPHPAGSNSPSMDAKEFARQEETPQNTVAQVRTRGS